jgi:hypothetical protein
MLIFKAEIDFHPLPTVATLFASWKYVDQYNVIRFVLVGAKFGTAWHRRECKWDTC